MSKRFAILCPGQGGQHPAMFDLVRAEGRAASEIATVERLLGQPLDRMLADPHTLFANRSAQTLVVGATLAVWEALRPMLPLVDLVAGYSVGEVSAHAVAGTLDTEAALSLSARRAACMDAAAATAAQGLLAVSGIAVSAAIGQLESHEVHLAIETGIDSFIVGGATAALESFGAWAGATGAHLTRLPVSVASHTPLMQAAAEPFALALRECGMRDPALPVLAGISGDRVTDVAQASDTLTRQLTQTVRWADCMDALAEAGVGVALELGPGGALARMLRERHPDIETRTICSFRSLQGAADWVERRVG